MLSLDVITNSNHKFLFKNSVFQKTSFHFHFFTQFLFYCEEFWESTYKKSCSRLHTRFKAYKIHCNHSKRRVVQEYLLGIEKNLYKLLSSWCREVCTDLAKVILSSSVEGVDFGCTKSGQENSQAGCLGTGRRSWGPNQDKSFVFTFAFFQRLFCAFFYSSMYFI